MFGTAEPDIMETLVIPFESLDMKETAPLLLIFALNGDFSCPR